MWITYIRGQSHQAFLSVCVVSNYLRFTIPFLPWSASIMASASHFRDSVNEKPSSEIFNPHNGSGLHLYPQPDRRLDSIAHRNYDDPIGRKESEDNYTLHGGVSSQDSYPSLNAKDSRAQLTKNEIRRRIKQKHKSKIPGHVKWTKWMHTESKNRTFSVIKQEQF